MKKKSIIVALCAMLVLSLFMFTACNGNNNELETVTITDTVRDTVEVPLNPERVAVFSRAAADKLVAFGLGDRITGVFESIPDNPWAHVILPNLSQLYRYSYRTNIETYLEHNVCLIIAPERHLAVEFRALGIPSFTVAQFTSPNFDNDIFTFSNNIKKIWDCLEVARRVDLWQSQWTAVRNEIETKLDGIEVTQSFYYVRGDRNRGLNHTENSEASFHNTVGRILRVNYTSRTAPTNQLTPEALIEADPNFIVIGGAFQHQLLHEAHNDARWQALTAVQNNRIIRIGVGFTAFEQQSVGWTIYLATMANNIWSDKFNFDLEQMVIDLMYDFYGLEISSQDAQNMLDGRDRNGNPLVAVS